MSAQGRVMGSPDLTSLKQRVAEATGPDRELDAALWAWAHGGYIEDAGTPGSGPVIWHNDNGWKHKAASIGDGMWRDRTVVCRADQAPALTSSLDATLSLIERKLPGVFWALSKGRTRPDEPLFACQLFWGVDRPAPVLLAEVEHPASVELAALLALLTALEQTNAD